jgi:hypothetical protein
MRRSTAVLCAGVMRLSAASGNLSTGCLNDFFVCANAVEMDVGFDLGAAASRLSYPVFFSLAAADKAPTRPSAHTWTMCVRMRCVGSCPYAGVRAYAGRVQAAFPQWSYLLCGAWEAP